MYMMGYHLALCNYRKAIGDYISTFDACKEHKKVGFGFVSARLESCHRGNGPSVKRWWRAA